MSAYSYEMDYRNYIIHPLKFALWLFILTVVMIFGGFTSAYIVQADALQESQRLIYDLPPLLWRNLAVILVSSVTLQFAIYFGKRNNRDFSLLGLFMTFGLGLLFLYGQWDAFGQLTESGLPFVDPDRTDNSIAFFYVITGLHGMHIVAALLVVLFVLIKTLTNSFKPGKLALNLELAGTFWHFLGLLWIYLFLFLKFMPDALKESI
ncbi:MAG: cytochrome c oxidase subunit 3 [Bacteroidia bacterium]|nr:cytochrome c oxidase subunit 3 [Bacteroidia bacterium]